MTFRRRCRSRDVGDEHGSVVNGDGVLLLAARDLHSRGSPGKGPAVVATTMSNMGLEDRACATTGIRMLRAQRSETSTSWRKCRRHGAVLGGEQSGHMLFRDGEATTGDGMLTALRVMEILARTGKPMAELVSDLKVFPQTIQNVRVREKTPFAQVPEIHRAIEAATRELDGNGRVVVRYSAPSRWPGSWSRQSPKRRCGR